MTPDTGTAFASMLGDARAQRVGVGAFNVVLLEHAEAIVAGAEAVSLPVILQISENCIRYHGRMTPIVTASRAIAAAASVPALVHLDHITSADLVRKGIDLGVDAVMFDGSTLPYDENVATTAEMVRLCHAAGVGIEAEIGEIGGKDGAHAPGVRTSPVEARDFARATGVDALAVAVGSSHAMQARTARLDLDLAASIAANVDVPLVLHGSSGVSDDQLSRAPRRGLTKINVSTHLNGIFTRAIRNELEQDALLVDPRRYIDPARSALGSEVARLLALIN